MFLGTYIVVFDILMVLPVLTMGTLMIHRDQKDLIKFSDKNTNTCQRYNADNGSPGTGRCVCQNDKTFWSEKDEFVECKELTYKGE